MSFNNELFKAYVVHLILNGRVDEALAKLSEHYKVERPRLLIKRVKGFSKVPAVYSLEKKAIYIQNGNYYNSPYVILHEFYHHLRNVGGKHRGTEENADRFALSFITAYKKYAILVRNLEEVT